MAGTWTSQRLPQFESAIRQLTEQHRQLKDEPLHLALSYSPQREEQDIFLLEVIGGADGLAENRELFETVFTSTPSFPMNTSQRLHLLLTTPSEWERAMSEGWPTAEEIRRAIAWEDYKVLYADDVGQRLLKSLQPETRRTEEVARG